jgi:hypothetical protein
LAFAASASIVYLTVGWSAARWILLPLIAAAALEGFVGYCLGCAIFGQLMKVGLIPEEVCADCADITRRYATSQK